MKVKIEKLTEHPQNPNVHKDAQIDEIVRSVKMFGQYRPVLVDEDYTILAGHGLTRAMQKMGESTIEVRVMKGLDDNAKRKLLLVDNQLSQLGSLDYSIIENIFQELADFDVPGFDQSVLESLLNDTDAQIGEYGKVESTEGLSAPTFASAGQTAPADALVCPGCGMVIEKKNL